MSNNDRSDRVYQDLKIFTEDHNGNKHPLTIGYAYQDGDKLRFRITCMPPAWARTDGSGVIEVREQRGQSSGSQRNDPPARSGGDRPAFGRGSGNRDNGGYRNDIE